MKPAIDCRFRHQGRTYCTTKYAQFRIRFTGWGLSDEIVEDYFTSTVGPIEYVLAEIVLGHLQRDSPAFKIIQLVYNNRDKLYSEVIGNGAEGFSFKYYDNNGYLGTITPTILNEYTPDPWCKS